ncbi:MAG: fused MFS/spermidine synthase [Candidatus Krumholzibacteriia bacterium]
MKRTTGPVVLLFFLSGASGLISELVWIKLFSQLLGGTTFAISAVLAAFMGGLALGSWRFGPLADRDPRPLRLYARLELAVAAASLAVPLLLVAIRPLYILLARAVPEPGTSLVRILVAAALVLPPTFFMGGTLPVLGRFLVRRGDRLGRGLGLLYAVNTLGAVVGAFLTGFVLIPALGLLPCVALAVAGNLVAGVTGLFLARRAGPAAPPAADDPADSAAAPARAASTPQPAAAGPELAPRLLAAVFALTGFAALGCELYWTRALSRFLGNTTYAFSAMLTTYLFGLAAGGWLGGRLADRVASPARLLGWTLLGSAAAFLASVPLIWNWLPTLDGSAWLSAPQQPWSSYLLKRFLASAAVMVVPTLLSGMTFPLVNRIGIASLSRLGLGVGRLYAANTSGAIAGSLAAGFVVLPLLGARRALLATALLSGAVGVTVLLAARRRRGGAAVWPAVAALAALVLLAPALDRRARVLLSDSQAPGDAVLFDREDPTAETRVYRKPDGELHMSVDGRHIGGTEPGIVRKEKILAHLPVALTPRARNVLAVGLGSGITLGALGLYDEVERLTCVEIVPSVVEGARLFAAANHNVLADPRLHLVVGDGVQFLLTTRERFDVISSDSKLNPEFVGNSAILAREFYALCREHLTERGVVIQWTATHLPNTETRIVTRTFCESFPYVELFWIDPSNVILVGSRSPIALDADRWAERARDPAVRADLASQLLDDLAVTASYRVAGRPQLAAALGAGPVNSWLRPVIEFQTVREFQLKPIAYHESDNLRWLRGLWTAEGLPVTGAADAARLARFRVSTGRYLEGYSLGTGLNRLAAGRAALAAGLAANPDDTRLSRLLGMLQDEATAAQADAPADPRDANQWLTLGLDHLDARRPAAALAAFDRALALQPGARDARYDRLLALRQLGRTAEVAAEGTRYTRDFPRDARGWSYHGRNRAEAGDLAGAAAAFARAVELDPTTASYRNNLAVTLSRQGRWREAAAAFAAVQALDPVFPDAAYNAAAAWSRAGDQAEAWRWVETCLAKGLADPARLLADSNLAALRAAPQWDGARVAAAVAAAAGR